jgi:hypothetical protein
MLFQSTTVNYTYFITDKKLLCSLRDRWRNGHQGYEACPKAYDFLQKIDKDSKKLSI